MKRLLTLALCGLFLVSCNQRRQIVAEDALEQITEQTMSHGIHLEKESGLVYCYADSQKIAFGDIYLDDGAKAMLLHQQGNYAYVVGDIVPNSDGWTVRYHLYKVDKQTLETKHIGDFAAIHFEDDGFKAATTRLTNPDAECTADEIFAIHDVYFNNEGQQISENKSEYRYDEMQRIYSDCLVNAVGFRY